MRSVIRSITIAVLFAQLTSCVTDVEIPTLPAFRDVDGAKISCHSQDVASVTQSIHVSAIVDFINQHQDNWSVPWAGVPVPTASVELYRGGQLLGSFGAGVNFFERYQQGVFSSRDASATDLATFKRLLISASERASLASCWR